MAAFDHFILGVRDLTEACADFQLRAGVVPRPGGRHPLLGTHNALTSLGSGVYFEILAPDPERPDPALMKVEALNAPVLPRMIGWALQFDDFAESSAALAEADLTLSKVGRGERRTPEGDLLQYEFADIVGLAPSPNLAPFFVKWLNTTHPSLTAPAGCRLESVRLGIAGDEKLRAFLDSLRLPLEITHSSEPFLEVRIGSAKGSLSFR